MSEDNRNPFKILGINPQESTLADAKKAYKKLAREHHPDKLQGARQEVKAAAEAMMQDLNWAIAQLEDETMWGYYQVDDTDREAMANIERAFNMVVRDMSTTSDKDVFEVLRKAVKQNLRQMQQSKSTAYRENRKFVKATHKLTVDKSKPSAFIFKNVLMHNRQTTVNDWYQARHNIKVLERALELLDGHSLVMWSWDTTTSSTQDNSIIAQLSRSPFVEWK